MLHLYKNCQLLISFVRTVLIFWVQVTLSSSFREQVSIRPGKQERVINQEVQTTMCSLHMYSLDTGSFTLRQSSCLPRCLKVRGTATHRRRHALTRRPTCITTGKHMRSTIPNVFLTHRQSTHHRSRPYAIHFAAASSPARHFKLEHDGD